MPIVYRADRDLGCTIVVWDGDVTTRDTEEQLRRLSADPDWPAGARHLIDGTTVDAISVPDPELVELLFEGTRIRRAALVRPDLFDEAREHTPRYDFATFTDRDAACAYLGLDSLAVQAVIDDLRHELSPFPDS